MEPVATVAPMHTHRGTRMHGGDEVSIPYLIYHYAYASPGHGYVFSLPYLQGGKGTRYHMTWMVLPTTLSFHGESGSTI